MPRVVSELDDFPIHTHARLLRDASDSHRDFDDATYFFAFDRAGAFGAFFTLEIFPRRNLKRSAVFVRVGHRHLRSVRFEKLEDAPGRVVSCGENRFEIEDPHRRWSIALRDEVVGLDARLTWRPRCPGYLFPHVFLEREGEPAVDMQHYTTSSVFEGSFAIGGARFEGLWGHRCRSWGVRRWSRLPFYTWLNAQLDDRCVNLWLLEDPDGAPLYCAGALTTPGGEVRPVERFEHDILELHEPHQKRARRRTFRVWLADGEHFTMDAEEVGSIILAVLPDDWSELDAAAMDAAQKAALWYEQHTRFRIGSKTGYGFIENLVAPGSRRHGIPATEFPPLDPGAFDDEG